MAENSTEAKKKSVKALKIWVQDFRGVTRIAVKDAPQILEIFGIAVTSEV